jgi:putative phosphoesterase
MKIGLFSDVHGNIDALKLCLGTFRSRGVDRLVFLGDAIGYLPDAVECLELIQSSDIECVMGNHEAMLLDLIPLSAEKDKYYKLKSLRANISRELLDFISEWPEQMVLELGAKTALLVHGNPADPLGGYTYPDSDLSGFANLDFDAIVMGQTHRPFIRQNYNKVFVNVGSVGLPRDEGDLLGCAILDAESFTFEILRQRFDTTAITTNNAIHPEIRDVFTRRTPFPVGTIVS